jgi:hypothetical protein
MAGQIDKVNVNGNLVDWNSQEFKLGGDVLTGYTELSWDHKRPRTKGYGAGRNRGPRGRSGGKYETSNVKAKMYADSANALRKWAAAKAPDGVTYTDAVFPGVYQEVEPGFDTHVTVFEQMCIESISKSASEGGDPNMVDVEFSVMRIIEDGLSMFSQAGGR